VSLDLLVVVALDPFLLTSLHRWYAQMDAPMVIGSTGAEGLAAALLTSSLDNSTLNAPMPVFDSSVKPVPKGCLNLISSGTKTCTDAWASVYPETIGCTDGLASV